MTPRYLDIFIEGDPALRPGFSQLLRRALDKVCREHQVVLRPQLCGDHGETLKKCLHAAKLRLPCLLLIDADEPLASRRDAREHLQALHRSDQLNALRVEQVHLMVVEMEAWLVCDEAAWQTVFKGKANLQSLPRMTNIETLSKPDLQKALKKALPESQERYHKIQHGHPLLEALSPQAVRPRAPHFARLIDALDREIRGLGEA